MTDFADVFSAAAEVEAFCRRQQWRFCFIGGIAVQRWGMPRFTQDVDLTLLTGFGGEEEFVTTLLGQFSGRLSNARQFALDNRVLLARTHAGVSLDFALGALPFEEAMVTRATLWTVADEIVLTTCSAEDLIIHKVFASRDRDWSDVESILSRQFGLLDLPRIHQDLLPLLELKEDPEALQKLDRMIADVQRKLAR